MKIKKIIASTLSAALAFSSMTLSAFAADSPSLNASKNSVVRGEYFTVSLDITEPTGNEIASASATLEYDSEAFEFVSPATTEIGDVVANANISESSSNVKFSINDMSLSKKTGKLLTAKFFVKNDAVGGDKAFKVTDYWVKDKDSIEMLNSTTNAVTDKTINITAPEPLEVKDLTIEDSKKATWTADANAADYTVSLEYNGKEVYSGKQTATEFNFVGFVNATGIYTVKVTANSNNSLYLTSVTASDQKEFTVDSQISISNKEYVTGSDGFDVVITPNGNTFQKITAGSTDLVKDTDYTYNASTQVVHINESYLANLATETTLSFVFDKGAAAELKVKVAKAADGATLILAEREKTDKLYIDESGNDIDTQENDGTSDGAIVIASSDGPIAKFLGVQFSISNNADVGFDAVDYEIVPADGYALLYDEATGLYEINVKPANGVYPNVNTDAKNKGIVIGKLVYKGGYGKGTISANNVVMTTEKSDNTYKKQDISSFDFKYNIPEPAANLTVNVNLSKLPTKVDNVKAYQNMKLRVYSARLGFIDFDLGTDAVSYSEKNGTLDTTGTVKNDAGAKTYTLTLTNLPAFDKYTVFVSGDGYRDAKAQFDLNEDTTVDFWNNANDSKIAQITKATSGIVKTENKNFLAGDIIMNGVIDLYDLSAVSSYFGKGGLTAGDKDYIQYDLNRDGKINIDDISMLLAGWAE